MYDLGIIGGGPAGYVAAERAGQKGLKVVLFEKNKIGGVCLNEGCVPTKTLLYSAKMYDYANEGSKYGINITGASFDFAKMIDRKNKVIKKLQAGINSALKGYKVDVVNDNCVVNEKKSDCVELKAGDNIYSCKNIMICTGSSPFIPPIKGLKREEILTNKEILDLEKMPKSLVVIGGGVIGLEFGSFFNSLGCEVHVIEMLEDILPGTDEDLKAQLKSEYTKKGIKFYLKSRVVEIKGKEVFFEKDGKVESVKGEQILVSVGRRPNIEGIGLEKLGVVVERNAIKVDDKMRTNIPNVYACGDITGFSLLAHTASREGEVVVNNLLGRNDVMRYDAIPAVVYTNPEVASVGLTEAEAKKKNIKYTVKTLPMAYSGRFIAENEGKNGICKVLVDEKYKNVIGVHMLGSHCSEMIFGAAIMIESELRLKDVEEVVFPHPTVSEIIRETVFHFNDK